MMVQNKNRQEILNKLGIEKLNPMQQKAEEAILAESEIILLSPTGTGKTLAFLLPIIESLDPNCEDVQVLILVPSRELAIQIEQVIREIGSGFKANAVYGGRSGSKDKLELKHAPAILVGTPGRVADHLRRQNISVVDLKTLVLDEFDKSLETGFEKEMIEIIEAVPFVKKKVLTSATQGVEIPIFVGLRNPTTLDFLDQKKQQLTIKTVVSPSKNKLGTLEKLIGFLDQKNGIIFCNYKDSIHDISDHLHDQGIEHECFYGGLEQIDRERALIKFRNGTTRLLIATDLAARGIDVPELDFIIHCELPHKEEEFTHRNGRTARMNSTGTAYVLKSKNEKLPYFINDLDEQVLLSDGNTSKSDWKTIYISGGRKDKISKGDIAGLFMKQGELKKDELGIIELKNDCAFVAVPRNKVRSLVSTLNNSRLKKKKVRISLLE